jgi:hypothetical protein
MGRFPNFLGVPGYYSLQGPGAFQIDLKMRPAAKCSEIGLRKAPMDMMTPAKSFGASDRRFLRRNPRHWLVSVASSPLGEQDLKIPNAGGRCDRTGEG